MALGCLYGNWKTTGDSTYDIAILKLNQPLGSKTGYFGYTTSFAAGDSFQTAGYPRVVQGIDPSWCMWKTSGTISSIQNGLIISDLDTSGGQSGSPAYNKYYQAIGIVTGHYKNTDYGHIITPITSDSFQWIQNINQNYQSIYRIYNNNSGEHIFTVDLDEALNLQSAGWTIERVAWFVDGTGAAVYRLYNPNAGDHFYTVSTTERDNLVSAGWKNEGIAFYVKQSGTNNPIYRLYNPNAKEAGAHMFTASTEERDQLVAAGWKYEGVAWYGVSTD
jgi:hypothetical protein